MNSCQSYIKGDERKFTLIELLVVVAVVSILAAMLLPMLSKARDRARESSCVSRCKEISIAVFNYADSYNGYVPPGYSTNYPHRFVTTSDSGYGFGRLVIYGFLPGIRTYGSTSGNFYMLHCPANKIVTSGGYTSYTWFNGFSTKKASICRIPAEPQKNQLWMFGDNNGEMINMGGVGIFPVSDNHSSGKSNWARYDGSVRTLSKIDMEPRIKGTQTFRTPKEVTL